MDQPLNVISIVLDTLRRDHCGPYHQGRPLNACGHAEQPNWVVPTPNLDRLAARGTVFDNCWNGSTPCMPARRDIYTGRYEFLERGWGPLEDDDLDLPRQLSGQPNRSMQAMREAGDRVSFMVTDHFHLWEQGSGNYHMGYTGFEFIRGMESDAWRTDPIYADDGAFDCPVPERRSKTERHYRNVHFCNPHNTVEDSFPAKTFGTACQWLERNAGHEGFYLHIDSFPPHEPWDPPAELVRQFTDVPYPDGWTGNVAYAPWREHYTPEMLRNIQARYAAYCVLVDMQLGRLLDTLDAQGLWESTVVIVTSDHGTWNGDHGRIGKLGTHTFTGCSRIPLIVSHPTLGQGERRSQLTQLVDLYPTTLSALGKPIPPDRHGVDLLPVLADASAPTRDYAVAGMFGKSVTITDGTWAWHQSPVPANQPLNWYGHPLARFISYDLGDYQDGRRPVHDCQSWNAPSWLSDLRDDPAELTNLAEANPQQAAAMQHALRDTLGRLRSPAEQLDRLGLTRA